MMRSSTSSPLAPPFMRPTMNTNTSFETTSILGNSTRRKRRRNAAGWAKLATKCVVSSPLIVLVLFGVLCFRTSPTTTTRQQQGMYTSSSSSKNNGVVQPPQSQQQQQAFLKKKQSLLSKKKTSSTFSANTIHADPVDIVLSPQQQQQGVQVVVRPRPPAASQEAGTLQQQQQEQEAMQASQEGVAGTDYVENWKKNQQAMRNVQGQNTMKNVQGQNTMKTVQGQNTMKNVQGQNTMMAPERVVTGVSYKKQGSQQEAMTSATKQNANVVMDETLQQQAVAATELQQATKLSLQDANVVSMMNPQGSTTNTKESLQLSKNTRIMYYDPSSSNNHNGIPETVYDASGKAYSLASLQSPNTEIYMEKAMTLSQEERSLPLDEFSLPETYTWGQDQKQDNFIIVATVATMALLVGALSARRLRSRNFLNSCIENEEEVVYDSAYTSSTTAAGYDTFAWKGDLEKFDV